MLNVNVSGYYVFGLIEILIPIIVKNYARPS